MPNIIAGRFQELERARTAMRQLVESGFGRNEMASFFVGPAGQHEGYALQGGEQEFAGTEQSALGAATGALGGVGVGTAVGLAGGPIGAIAGAAVGAYVGSFVGALHTMQEDPAAPVTPVGTALHPRKSGVVVAVLAPEAAPQARAIDVLQKAGAEEIEHAEGNITTGEWTDFNPLTSVSPVA